MWHSFCINEELLTKYMNKLKTTRTKSHCFHMSLGYIPLVVVLLKLCTLYVNYELDMNVTTFLVDFDAIRETTQKESPERMPEKVVANFI